MVMIIFALCSMSLYVIGTAVVWAEGQFRSFLGEMICLWVISLIVCVFDVLIINLNLLHLYLNCKGITTYEFIMMNR